MLFLENTLIMYRFDVYFLKKRLATNSYKKKRKGVHYMKYLDNLNLGDLEAIEKLSNLIKSGKVKIVSAREESEKQVDETGKKVLWGLAIIGAVAAVVAIAVAVYKILSPEQDDFDDDFDDDFFNDTEEEKEEEAAQDVEETEEEVEEEVQEESEEDVVAAVEEAIEEEKEEVAEESEESEE